MKRYDVSQEQINVIKHASRPTPVMYLSGGRPMGPTARENVNTAWRRLGEELGFDYMTVVRIPEVPETAFMAEPKEDA